MVTLGIIFSGKDYYNLNVHEMIFNIDEGTGTLDFQVGNYNDVEVHDMIYNVEDNTGLLYFQPDYPINMK